MITEPNQETRNGVTYNVLTSLEPFYAVGYETNSSKIILMSPNEDSPQKAGSRFLSKLDGFSSDSWDEFINEIYDRGLVLPV